MYTGVALYGTPVADLQTEPAPVIGEGIAGLAFTVRQVGGPVPVALTAAARLGGVECVHLGVVGNDREADDVATALTEQGVEPSAPHRDVHAVQRPHAGKRLGDAGRLQQHVVG